MNIEAIELTGWSHVTPTEIIESLKTALAKSKYCEVSHSETNAVLIGFKKSGVDYKILLKKRIDSSVEKIEAAVVESGSTVTSYGNDNTRPVVTGAWSDVTLSDPVGNNNAKAGDHSKIWFVGLDDAFFIVITKDDLLAWSYMLHAGRIAVSTNSSDAAAIGQDGLGVIGGQLYSPSNKDAVYPSNANYSNGRLKWKTGVYESFYFDTPSISDRKLFTDYNPVPPLIVSISRNNNQSMNYGVTKYIRHVFQLQTFGVAIAKGGDPVGWLRIDSNQNDNATYINVIPWPAGVAPK